MSREGANTNTLLDLVEQFHGDRPAIVQFRPDEVVSTLSYGQLAANVRGGAAGLQALGVGSGELVAIWAPNSAEWIIAYFAIIAAGAIVLPLDEQLRADHLQRALRRLAPTLVFTVENRLADLCGRFESAAVAN